MTTLVGVLAVALFSVLGLSLILSGRSWGHTLAGVIFTLAALLFLAGLTLP